MIYGFAMREGGTYTRGPNAGQPYEAGDLLRIKGQVVVTECQSEADSFCPPWCKITELDGLPDPYVRVKQVLPQGRGEENQE